MASCHRFRMSPRVNSIRSICRERIIRHFCSYTYFAMLFMQLKGELGAGREDD
jgi:hypothetical protein